jgi:hypothetical protein
MDLEETLQRLVTREKAKLGLLASDPNLNDQHLPVDHPLFVLQREVVDLCIMLGNQNLSPVDRVKKALSYLQEAELIHQQTSRKRSAPIKPPSLLSKMSTLFAKKPTHDDSSSSSASQNPVQQYLAELREELELSLNIHWSFKYSAANRSGEKHAGLREWHQALENGPPVIDFDIVFTATPARDYLVKSLDHPLIIVSTTEIYFMPNFHEPRIPVVSNFSQAGLIWEKLNGPNVEKALIRRLDFDEYQIIEDLADYKLGLEIPDPFITSRDNQRNLLILGRTADKKIETLQLINQLVSSAKGYQNLNERGKQRLRLWLGAFAGQEGALYVLPHLISNHDLVATKESSPDPDAAKGQGDDTYVLVNNHFIIQPNWSLNADGKIACSYSIGVDMMMHNSDIIRMSEDDRLRTPLIAMTTTIVLQMSDEQVYPEITELDLTSYTDKLQPSPNFLLSNQLLEDLVESKGEAPDAALRLDTHNIYLKDLHQSHPAQSSQSAKTPFR